MTQVPFPLKPGYAALLLAGLLAACGGGGSDATDPPLQVVRPGSTTQTETLPGGGEMETGGPGVVTGDTDAPATGDAPDDTGAPDNGETPDEGTGTGTGTGDGDGDHEDGTAPTTLATMMACADAPPNASSIVQCSGDDVLRSDNGIGVTRSGVQVWGKSTRDDSVIAWGLAPAGFTEGMRAGLRIARDPATGAATAPALLLDHLDLSWDGQQQRPPIIDTFHAGGEARVTLGEHGEIVRTALPASADLAFYDYAHLGSAGTQAHYANNVYFPRSPANPARCPVYINPESIQCQTESVGIRQQAVGNWRSGGTSPDRASAMRFHEDGDVHAGDAASGEPPILDGGSGFGAPFPGSKGYRSLEHLGYRYANLAAWFSQDTVGIVEWTGGPGVNEHNKNRRGLVSFGETTDPTTLPASGTVNYSGIAWVWHSLDGLSDPSQSSGTVTVTVDLARHEATLVLQNTDAGLISATLRGEAGNSAWANYLTGSGSGAAMLAGGFSARYFGPVNAGSGGTGPAEMGGAFTMTTASGQAIIGGFIALKR